MEITINQQIKKCPSHKVTKSHLNLLEKKLLMSWNGKVHYPAVAALNSLIIVSCANMNSNHFEALTEHPDSSISAINRNITQRTNLLVSLSGPTATTVSPKQQESKSKVQSIAQNNAGHQTLKRGKSAAKFQSSGSASAKMASPQASATAALASNSHHNSSVLSANAYASSSGAERQA